MKVKFKFAATVLAAVLLGVTTIEAVLTMPRKILPYSTRTITERIS